MYISEMLNPQTVLLFLTLGCKMSWFADLAGKAEDFLNKVDQGAATALSLEQTAASSFSSGYEGESLVKPDYNTAGYKTDAAVTHHTYAPSHDASSFISAAAGNIKRSNTTLLSGSASMALSGSGSSAPNSAKTSSGFVRPRKSEQDVDDDMLFDFLNSLDPPASNRTDSRKELVTVTEAQDPAAPDSTTHSIPSAPPTPPSTHGVSRASSMSSLSAHSMKTSEESSAKEQSPGMINKTLHVRVVIFLSSVWMEKLQRLYNLCNQGLLCLDVFWCVLS